MNEPTNFGKFLNKPVKIILTPPGGNVISYYGELLEEDNTSLLLTNKRDGVLLIAKKDISQILEAPR
ncbi:MAG: hypothetical protein ABIJ21_06345 [Nanoarchaeota archaeon]